VTRRILLVLVAFTAAVIAGAMIPLALNTIKHDQTAFTEAVEAAAKTDAAVAQSRLDALHLHRQGGTDDASDAPLLPVLKEEKETGDGLYIVSSVPALIVANQNMPRHGWMQLVSEANQEAQRANEQGRQPEPRVITTESMTFVALPVLQNGIQGPVVGVVVLTRANTPLNRDIFDLWVILGTIGVAALLGAAVLAFALARWVSRPLAGLDSAAGRLADGDLAIRAKVRSGPLEIRRLGTTFNTMAGRLEALVHGSRAVIADVSHQLRTPLAALRLRLDLLAADTDPDTGHELAGALDELARLSRLVDGLLAVARAEGVVPVPVAVDVGAVARERVAAWHPVADDRSIVLVVTLAGSSGGLGNALGVGRYSAGPVLAWIGEGHLEQILDNLIANALEALNPGQLVRLTTAATATGARITVSDNGPGMSAEDRERAFLRFTTSSPNGTGLGLAIVHRLAISNGGTARLDETPGGGLTVTLDFPGVPALSDGGHAGGARTEHADGAPTRPDVFSL
jgi:signal transduction histidine kinase